MSAQLWRQLAKMFNVYRKQSLKDLPLMQCLTAARNNRGTNNKLGTKKDHVYAVEPPCSAEDICETTRRNPVLAKVILGLQSGSWPSSLLVELAPFHRREMELSVVNGLVIWGQRVIIPQKWRQVVKNEFYEGYFGSHT